MRNKKERNFYSIDKYLLLSIHLKRDGWNVSHQNCHKSIEIRIGFTSLFLAISYFHISILFYFIRICICICLYQRWCIHTYDLLMHNIIYILAGGTTNRTVFAHSFIYLFIQWCILFSFIHLFSLFFIHQLAVTVSPPFLHLSTYIVVCDTVSLVLSPKWMMNS